MRRSMEEHAAVCGGVGPWRGQLLRRLDAEPHERHDQLQRRFPAGEFLFGDRVTRDFLRLIHSLIFIDNIINEIDIIFNKD